MEDMLKAVDCLLDPGREHWERMHAVQDLEWFGPVALPYLFEGANLDWSHDPNMMGLIGDTIANIWSKEGALMTATTEGLPQLTIAQIETHRSFFREPKS